MLVVGTAWGINYIPVYQRNDASVGGGALRALDSSSSVGCLVCFLLPWIPQWPGTHWIPTLAMQFASCCRSPFTEWSKPTNALHND